MSALPLQYSAHALSDHLYVLPQLVFHGPSRGTAAGSARGERLCNETLLASCVVIAATRSPAVSTTDSPTSASSRVASIAIALRGRSRYRIQTTASVAATTTASVVLTEMMMTVVVERGGGAVHVGRSSDDRGDAVPDTPVREGVGPDDKNDGCPAGSAVVDRD